PQHLDVGVAVATIASGRAGWPHEAAALIDAQRLRVHSGELGGHRDDVHRLGATTHHEVVSRVRDAAAAASCSIAVRSCSESCVGTATSIVTMRSPVPFFVAMPLPFTRWRLPGC